MKGFCRMLVLCVLLAVVRPAAAHPVPFSYLDVKIQPTNVEVSLVVHIFDVAHDLGLTPIERLLDPLTVKERAPAIQSLLAPRLSVAADGQKVKFEWSEPEILRDRQSLRLVLRGPMAKSPGLATVAAHMFPYDPQHQTFINVYERDVLTSQMILDQSHLEFEHFCGTRQGTFAVVRRFVPSGIHHILIGPDHILFLIGLLLLGGSIRRLLLVVTSFTVAHSITLSLAALNIFNPPANLIEPAIALSIVYVGADNILAQGGRDVRPWIALAFGFIHGFGFANVLREMNLPTGALGWSLFAFNFGVEIGQLLIVVTVATALAGLRSRSETAARKLAFAGSIVVIIAGAFWFVQRVFFPGGFS